MWLPVDGSDDPKIPSGKGKWLIALHAGNREEGLIDRVIWFFLPKLKMGIITRNERAHLSKLVQKSAYASIKKPKCYRFR
jgi:hypothetical protein